MKPTRTFLDVLCRQDFVAKQTMICAIEVTIVGRQITHRKTLFEKIWSTHIVKPHLELAHAMIDHNVSGVPGCTADMFAPARRRIVARRENCRKMGVELFDINYPRQGIAHVIAPELGIQTDLLIPAQEAFVHARVYDHTGLGGYSQ
jgi:homoaconitase/3-isopropylmalate dehydratase large subunit